MKNTIFFIAASAIFTSAWAGNVQIQVLDRDSKPVPDAVVVVYPSATTGAAPSLLQPSPTIEQERMRFVPAVTVVMPGSTVRFTNQDRWDHHVRGNPTGAAATAAPAAASSNFELRLAGKADGKPASFADVKLDTPGVVLLGCHLHGSMRGHVFVTDSAWTLKTDADGIARFTAVPDGAAQLRVARRTTGGLAPQESAGAAHPGARHHAAERGSAPPPPSARFSPCASKSGQRAAYPLLIATVLQRSLSAASEFPSTMQ